jgi:hypothetical protein
VKPSLCATLGMAMTTFEELHPDLDSTSQPSASITLPVDEYNGERDVHEWCKIEKTKTRPIVSADNHDNFGSRNEELDTGLINLAVLLAAVLSEVSSSSDDERSL